MNQPAIAQIRVVDSHTGGEPTRVVIEGGPTLGSGTLPDRCQRLREQFDGYRSAIVNEPRGSDVMVGALLVEPDTRDCAIGVIFFNNVGYLGMCGHGTIGVIATLAHLGRIAPGRHRIQTPVGIVTAILHTDARVSVENVPGYRKARDVRIEVPGVGVIGGDIAWGGNWFFLTEVDYPITIDRVQEYAELAIRIRNAVNESGFPEVDHVEFTSAHHGQGTSSRNFVLCPGNAYDRSPCGTGTSARLACLAADGILAEGDIWVQESIVGSQFQAYYRREGDKIIPTITGAAYITGEAILHLDPRDPFCWGIARS